MVLTILLGGQLFCKKKWVVQDQSMDQLYKGDGWACNPDRGRSVPSTGCRCWLDLKHSSHCSSLMQVQKPQMTNVPSKAITTKQRIKPTEMISLKNYSDFSKLCLYQGDRAKPTDGSAMWPEKCN